MNIRYTYLDVIGCSHGLLCLLIDPKNIVLCNPLTREFRELPYPPTSEYIDPAIYGFGYDSSTDDYKVIMGFSVQSEIRMEILALKTNTWRKIQNFNYGDASRTGVLVNGVIHWIVLVSYTNSRFVRTIVGLDLVEEKWFEVPQPDHNNENHFSQLTVVGGCLCLARLVDDYTCQGIWLMKEYGVGESWTKLISLPTPKNGDIDIWVPHCFMNNGEILIWRDDVKLFIYNKDEGTFKELEICNGPSNLSDSWSYKESLVSPYKNLINFTSEEL